MTETPRPGARPLGATNDQDKRYRVVVDSESRPPAPYDKKMRAIRFVAGTAVAVALLLLAALCFVPIEDYYNAVGIVLPDQYADLYAAADCITSEALVGKNDRVTTGQILFVFDLPELREQIDSLDNSVRVLEAELQLAKARTSVKEILPLPKELWEMQLQIQESDKEVAFLEAQLRRYEELFKGGAASRRDVEKAKYEYESAAIENKRLKERMGVIGEKTYTSALVQEARSEENVTAQNLEKQRNDLRRLREKYQTYSALRTPMSGKVLLLNNDHHGERIQRGQLLAYVGASDRRIVEIAGDQQNYFRVHPGQLVRYRSDTYDPFKYGYAEGHVFNVSPVREQIDLGVASAGTAKRHYQILASVEKEPVPLKLDSTVTAQIVLRKDMLFKIILGLDKFENE